MRAENGYILSFPEVRHSVRLCRSAIYAVSMELWAFLDRITHHVHILEMNGDSYRLKGSRQSAAALAPASDRPAAD